MILLSMIQKYKIVVFDLDDTLYKEIDFLKSAFRAISYYIQSRYGIEGLYLDMIRWYEEGKDVFGEILSFFKLGETKDELVKLYREHYPSIFLDAETESLLKLISTNRSCVLGLLTDGRIVTQENKIRALGINRYIEKRNTFISEKCGHSKPDTYSYKMVESLYPNSDYYYVGDNIEKDFLAPNQLGWTSICLLDDGSNIHKQNFNLSARFLPNYCIEKIGDLSKLI